MVTAQEQLQRVTQAQQRLQKVSRISPAQRRQLTRTGLVKERQRQARITEGQKELKITQKQIETFQKEQKKVEVQRTKQKDAVKTLIDQIKKNLKEKPAFLSGSGIGISKKAFELAGLDPKQAEKIFIKTIETNPVFEMTKAQAGRVKLAKGQIDTILSKENITVQDLFDVEVLKGVIEARPPRILSARGIDVRGLDIPELAPLGFTPTQIGLPSDIKGLEFKQDIGSIKQIETRLSDIGRKIRQTLNIPVTRKEPVIFIPKIEAEKGLIGAIQPLIDPSFKREQFDIKIDTSDITTDLTSFVPSGKGTIITEQRQKTFFEKFGIDPDDKSSQN